MGWQEAGYEVFTGFNVPSKAFGEYVEARCETPSVSAGELKAMMDGGEDMVLLDSRPMDEFRVFNIPGATDVQPLAHPNRRAPQPPNVGDFFQVCPSYTGRLPMLGNAHTVA